MWSSLQDIACRGDWNTALPHLHCLYPNSKHHGIPRHIGALQLAFTVLLRCGDKSETEYTLITAGKHYGFCIDYYLMECSFYQFFKLSFSDGISSLVQVYRQSNLAMLDFKNPKKSLSLDNLSCRYKSKFFPNTQPLITVIVPVFNGEATLGTALQSLLDQSWQALEILIVDDCSTDETLKIATDWAERDSRIRVLRNHTNQGAYAARNTGLVAAKGEFITTHDADDWSHCQKIELQVNALIDNDHFMASASHWARCSSDLVFGTWRQEESWIYRNVSSLMFRRSVFNQLGYWDRVSVNADTEYYYRIIAAYGQQSIVEVKPGVPLAFGRMEPGSLTMTSETHLRTQFGGVRKDYMDAAHRWHRSQQKLGNYYMSFNPKERPFPAPSLIDRRGCYFGEHYYPVYPGRQVVKAEAKTVLLCAHAAGNNLFGGERSFLDLVLAASRNHYKVVVTLPEKGSCAYVEALLEHATAVIVFPYQWWHGLRPINLRVVADFEKIIAAWQVDLLHVNTLVLREPLQAARNRGIPGLMHVRELPFFDPDLCEDLGATPEKIRQHVLQWADGFIVNSQCTWRFINQPDRSFLLYNAVSDVAVTKSIVDNKKIRFAMISSNIPKKGLSDFVELAHRAVDQAPDAEFVLIGPINEHVDALKQGAGLPSNLVVAGYAESPALALNQADVVLNLSGFQESFGRTIAEAMLAGRAVIGYRWGALPELIDNCINGYLVHLGDVDGLLRRVAILSKDRELLTAIGTAGRDKVQQHFSLSVLTSTLKDIYSHWLV